MQEKGARINSLTALIYFFMLVDLWKKYAIQ